MFRLTKKYDYSPLFSVFYYTDNRRTKRALLSYRPLQLRMWSKTTWSGGRDVCDMVHALSELGYVIDVVYSRDTNFLPKKHYDVFIGHEGYNFQRIAEHVPKDTPKILFTATAHWKFLHAEEDKRIQDIYTKTGVLLQSERHVKEMEDVAFQLADGIIMSGNEACKKTYPPSEKIYTLETASFAHKKVIDVRKKDLEAGKNNFLLLSGSGNAHKGLDLLLEVFCKIPGKHLYICSTLEEDFARVYEKELFYTHNIHYMGYVKAYGKKFYEMMYGCNFLMFPSSSEGSPGSVVDCMMQGLIPLVSRASHIDIDGLGYYIDPCTKDRIAELVADVSRHEIPWYAEKSAKIQAEARERFSPELFRKKFKTYIHDIVERTSVQNV